MLDIHPYIPIIISYKTYFAFTIRVYKGRGKCRVRKTECIIQFINLTNKFFNYEKKKLN